MLVSVHFCIIGELYTTRYIIHFSSQLPELSRVPEKSNFAEILNELVTLKNERFCTIELFSMIFANDL